jgi:hypothetical protein
MNGLEPQQPKVVPKLVPLATMLVPTGPLVGLTLLMVGVVTV